MIRNVRQLITMHEGVRLKPYKDTVGKLTIGIGRNLDDVGISDDEALFLFEKDIAKKQKSAKLYTWFDGLDEVRQAVVVDMIYQLGPGGFRKFVKTKKHIKAKYWNAAAKEMLDSKWARQTPTRARRLAKMMRTGLWPV